MSRTMFLPFGGDIFRDHQMWGQGDRMDRFWPLRHRFFYRATRMHSADYAVARYPSVRLSHASILSKRSHRSSFFSPSGSPSILVFTYQTGWQYSDGNPLTGASNARGYEKNHDFRPISRFISEMMQDRVIVTMEGE